MKVKILQLTIYIFLSSFIVAQTPCSDGGTIILNGDEIDAVLLENENTTGLSLPLWLNSGSTIAAGSGVKQISVIEFNEDAQPSGGNTLVYNQVISVGSVVQTVPANKVWKVESVIKTVNPFGMGRSIQTNAPICDGNNLSFIAPTIPNATYSWTGPNGFSSVSQNPTISNATVADGGDYTLTITLNGCTYSQTINAAITTPPLSTFTNTFLTAGFNGTFTPDDPGLTYSWIFDQGMPATSNLENPSAQWASSGNFDVTLTVTNNDGCSATSTTQVNVSNCMLGQPQSDFTWATGQANQNINFTASLTGANSYAWAFTGGTPSSGSGQNAVSQWPSAGSHNVTLTVSTGTGCYTTTNSVTVYSGFYTFTNCTQTGETGPTQGQCDSEYSGTSLAGAVSVVSGIQNWTVPNTGTYRIEVYGASGYGTYGGRGAMMSGDFNLTASDALRILVGQEGGCCVGSGNNQAGGGGGTFVVDNSNNPLIIAGGGGGSGTEYSGTSYGVANYAVTDATTSPSGITGSGSSNGAGGTAGGGGTGVGNAGGGGGFSGDGTVGIAGGKAFSSGGVGGTSGSSGGRGGFGGGGGADSWDNIRGGGGGGYSGGGGAGSSSNAAQYGGGGGSINNGTNQNNQGGVHTGHGQVVIYY